MEAKRAPGSSSSSSKERKLKRKEALEKKKAIDEIIKAASAVMDHLNSCPPFRNFERNGLSVYLESGCGEQLSSPTKKYIKFLLKVNMESPHGPDWPVEEKIKHREMVAPEARYIFVRETANATLPGNHCQINVDLNSIPLESDRDGLVGFVHYRFVLEEDIPVLYVYELQLESFVQGKGLGKFLMQLIELIARKNHLQAVMLTVQKANVLALNFYTNKLRYVISTISPSRVDPLIGIEKNYEILCKTFDQDAKAKLEENCIRL